MLVAKTLLGLVGLASVAFAADDDGPKDLGTVLAGEKNLTKYYDLIKKYPDVLLQLPSYNGVTIIAPSNDAFENIPYTALNDIWDPEDKDTTVPLLQYHILQGTVAIGAIEEGPTYVKPTLLTSSKYTNVTSGQNVLVTKQPGDVVVFTTSIGTRCTLVASDIQFQGGLIHVVDNLLIPPAKLSETADAFKVTSFLGGLYAGDLMPGVENRKNVTIFAPQDEAFDLVGGSLEDLDDDAIQRIMGYHVIPNQVLVSSSLTNGTRLDTLSDNDADDVLVRLAGNNKYINSAQIVQPDILIANGIMHLISNVLNPDASAASPDPDIGTQAPVFAASAVRDVFTSDLPCTTNCPVTTTPSTAEATSTTEAATTTTDVFTSVQDDAGAMATAHVAGAALGMIGVGMVLL